MTVEERIAKAHAYFQRQEIAKQRAIEEQDRKKEKLITELRLFNERARDLIAIADYCIKNRACPIDYLLPHCEFGFYSSTPTHTGEEYVDAIGMRSGLLSNFGISPVFPSCISNLDKWFLQDLIRAKQLFPEFEKAFYAWFDEKFEVNK